MLRLLYKGKDILDNEPTRYKFILDGKAITEPFKEAVKLIESIPKELRNCYIAFSSDIVLKTKYKNT